MNREAELAEEYTRAICALTVHNGLISRIDFVMTPDKLPDLSGQS